MRLRKEADVLCIGKKNGNDEFLASLGISTHNLDLTDPFRLKSKWDNFDLVVHLASVVELKDVLSSPQVSFNNNIQSTFNVLERVSLQKIKPKLFFPSSVKVYGNPRKAIVREDYTANPLEFYSTSKLCSEFLIKNYSMIYNIPYTIFRMANVFGPMQHKGLFIPSMIKQMIKGKKIKVGNIAVKRNFVYIKDLVDAYVLAWRSKRVNGLYNIASYSKDLREVLELLQELTYEYLDKKVKIVKDNTRMRPTHLDPPGFKLDCSRLKKRLGWKPKYTFENALRETFEFYLNGRM